MNIKPKMLTLLCLVMPLGLAACSSNNAAQKQAAKAELKPSLLETIDGVWVAEKYLSALKANKTPFVDHLESITVRAADKKLTWTNYHEGYGQAIGDSGQEGNLYFVSVAAPESTEPNFKKVHFSLLDNALIFLESGITGQTNTRFVKINEDLPQHANKLLLAGKYKDSEGNNYEFTADGKANWPNMSFSYTFVLDPSEATCPYINTSIRKGEGETVRFGYKWLAGQLYFFDITADEAPISCAKLPLFSLTKL